MIRLVAALGILSVCWGLSGATEAQPRSDLSGHFKLRGVTALYDEESLLREGVGATALDASTDLRLNWDLRGSRWDLEIDGQLIGVLGESLRPSQGGLGAVGRFPTDDRRALELTWVHHDGGSLATLARLDRASIGFRGRRLVVRVGRQAVSWGNGFAYAPMDIFNPFDPLAVDREYKAGDDMVYTQLSLPGGDDLQAVAVFRRDPLTGAVENEQGSVALKYHGLFGASELDVLVAEHYRDRVFGLGGSVGLGGAILRGDVVYTDMALRDVTSVVASINYSWVLGGKNWTGLAEYFHNGFGVHDARYDLASFTSATGLLERIGRGELFTLGRNYLALSTTIEVTPLFLFTPNLFVNLDDQSALLQLATQNNLAQDLVLQGALTIPFGPHGTEFGGIEAVAGRYLSSEATAFLQLALYF